ncbi:MAG TPA: CPBP family intramembrane glutamic endopeptidase [Bryobacteraceae bacterium]|nr:CPBP family intramembrane glutamic endopeptidase [Bryobacteraceae bacterium]
MKDSLGGFRAALLAGWIALSAAGLLYARSKGIPAWAALPTLAAFLIEYLFYLAAGFEEIREIVARRLAWFLVVSFVTPYIIYASNTGQFRWWALVQLVALATALSLWYKILPAGAFADLAFLTLVAAVVLRGYFDPIYTSPVPGLHLEILGHLALTHVCVMVMLVERRVDGIGFGFSPTAAEWKIGLRHFGFFLLAGIPLAWVTGLVHLGPGMPVWKITATFFGMLWVVALSEEFFFRGLLQQWMVHWTGSSAAGLAAASILFGAVHLGFRGFPNWRFALAAAVAGWFYGRAYQQAQSIRASMVTHALVVTLWRAWFV